MLLNAYFLAKFRFDTAENEPAKNLQNLPNVTNFASASPPRRIHPDAGGRGPGHPPRGPPRVLLPGRRREPRGVRARPVRPAGG